MKEIWPDAGDSGRAVAYWRCSYHCVDGCHGVVGAGVHPVKVRRRVAVGSPEYYLAQREQSLQYECRQRGCGVGADRLELAAKTLRGTAFAVKRAA